MVLILGIAWSVIFYLGKRTLNSIEAKIDENFQRIDDTNRLLNKMMERREKRIRSELASWTAKFAKQFRLLKADSGISISAQKRVCQRLFVSRQEFGAFTANINHKIDSIYEIVNGKSPEVKR
ncbi:MAG: hypothetical protein IEMM0002_0926 [bacterium]|nr:MAG: hypothetical protein IEMM0002_0926 [bacterium]